jgi:hypothetical protein
VPKAKKITARELAKKQHDEELVELGKRAKELCKRVEKGEKSTLALGKLLLKVRELAPEGGVIKWIQTNVGRSVSAINRCKYALSLADPDSTRNKRKSAEFLSLADPNIAPRNRPEPDDGTKANWWELKDIRKEVSLLKKAVIDGNVEDAVACRCIIMGAVDAMVKRTERFAFKHARKELARKLKASGDPAGRKILATEFDERTIHSELYSEQIPREERTRGYEKTLPLDFTGSQQEETAEKANAVGAGEF